MATSVAFLALAMLAGGVLDEAPAAERLKFGASGRVWEGNASVFFSAFADQQGSLSPVEADTTENLLSRVKELGGSATSSVVTAGFSTQILDDLNDGDYTTGWRVYANTNGAELILNLGTTFILHRVRMWRGVLTSDERSLRGYELYVNDGDSLKSFVGSEPVYSLIAQNPSHREPELDVRFPPQPVYFLKLRSTGERPFQMGDMEVFGIGITPLARYVSKTVDLGAPANFGPVKVHARIDPKAQVLFHTKTGTVPDDSLYFEQTGRLGELEEVSKDQFDRALEPIYAAGQVKENTRDWSPWSPPYPSLESPLLSPDTRRYLQFELLLLSNGLLDKAVIDSLVFVYTTPALADSVIGEISPSTAVLGERSSFTYHLWPVLSGEHRGFDTVFIATPFSSRATAVEVGEEEVDFTQEIAGSQLKVVFPGRRVEATGQRVTVHFESLVTVSGTEFRGQVGDSQSDAFPQHIIAGDASPEVESNGLVVGGKIEDRLFTGVQLSSRIITPNSDGSNDELTVNYILLKATSPVKIEVTVHDLAGAPVRYLYDRMDLSGPNAVTWDGRDASGRLVPPGLYTLRLAVDTDMGETAQLYPIAVVY